MEVVDTRLFCLAALSFYNQLNDDAQLRAFLSTFQMVVSLGPPYTQLLELIGDIKKWSHFQRVWICIYVVDYDVDVLVMFFC